MRYVMLSVLLALFSNVVVQAQIYKWVDKNGKTQYTDQPPPNGAARNETKLKINAMPTSATSDEENAPKSLAEEKMEYDERRKARNEAESKQLAEAQENEEKCNGARGRLKIFQESPRLTMPDGKGGIVYVDDDMRQEQIKEAEKNIAAFCK